MEEKYECQVPKHRHIPSTNQFHALQKLMSQTLDFWLIRSTRERLVDKIVRDREQIDWWQRQQTINAEIYVFSSELEAIKFCGNDPKTLFQL